MKKLCFTLIIFMFSLCIKGSYVYDEDDIYIRVHNVVDFCESGIKISYKTKSDIREILQQISDLNISYFNNTLKIDENMDDNFSFEEEADKASTKILIAKDVNEYTVEMEIIDKQKLINISEIKLKCRKLNNISNLNYYTFIKGKVKKQYKYELEDRLFNILDCYNIKNKSNVSLENGLTGIFTVQKTLKINYSIMNYDDGTYLIMGSPIIFITY